MIFKKTMREKAFAAAIVDHIVASTTDYIKELNKNIHKVLEKHSYDNKSMVDIRIQRFIIAAIVLDMQIVQSALGPYTFASIRHHVLKRLSSLDVMSYSDVESYFYRYQEACDSARERGVMPVGHDPLENCNLSSVLYDEMNLPYETLPGGKNVQSPILHLTIVDFFQNVAGITKPIVENYRIKR